MRRLASVVVTALGVAVLVAPAGTAHADASPPNLPTTDMDITGYAPDRAVPGNKITYRVTVTNNGPQAAAPYLAVRLPVGSTGLTHNGVPIQGGSVRMDSIAPGESRRVTVEAKVGNDGGETLLGSNFEVSQGPYDSPVYQDMFYANNILRLNTVNETAPPGFGYNGSIQLTGRVTGGSEPGQLVKQRLVIHNTGQNQSRDVALVGRVSGASGEIVKVTGLKGGRGVITKVGLNHTLPPLDAGTYRVITIVSKRSHAGTIGGSYFAGADGAGYPELELRG
ncbi:CARDB domain-containing protein [Streptomyces sp. NPDC005963]|uniref:CARDB domain-containing protein n=1 Tax=Streptomyces sp. NPDC005963 TaxID=3156721 RepID=UPI003405D3DA